MTVKICLSHCIHWAGGRCRLEHALRDALGQPECPHFDQRVASHNPTNMHTELP